MIKVIFENGETLKVDTDRTDDIKVYEAIGNYDLITNGNLDHRLTPSYTLVKEPTWKFDLWQYESEIFGLYWSFSFTNRATGKVLRDGTAENCTRDEAIECAERFFLNQTGEMYISRELKMVI